MKWNLATKLVVALSAVTAGCALLGFGWYCILVEHITATAAKSWAIFIASMVFMMAFFWSAGWLVLDEEGRKKNGGKP